jgi:hypothetical protein
MIAVRVFTTVLLPLLAACSSTPAQFSANESCNLPPNVWHQIPTPTDRDLLLGLVEPASGQPVREHFVSSRAQREAWLQDASGNLKACIYNPSQALSCYSGELTTVVFTKTDESWVAGPTLQGICVN